MAILKHRFLNWTGNEIVVYWFEDRYRYTVSTSAGIEYRERCWLYPFENYDELERIINEDIVDNPYGEQQFKAKCIRCSKWEGAPRKLHNLASICNRCYEAMNDTYGDGTVFYSINEDGSKGSVIK